MSDTRCLPDDLRTAANLIDQLHATNDAIQDWCKDHPHEVPECLRDFLEDLDLALNPR